jgi:tellurium resistance protein TerD
VSRSLARGANVALAAASAGVHRVAVGLAWQLDAVARPPLELDAQVILLGADGKVASEADLVFFSALEQASTAAGGAGAGSGDADVEQLVVDLDAVPARVERLSFSAAIYAAVQRGQSFRQVRSARIRVLDADTGTELVRHEVEPVAGTETAMVFGELYRHPRGWKFRAIGQGYAGGLGAVARDVGIRT